jgi:hypothetical protein
MLEVVCSVTCELRRLGMGLEDVDAPVKEVSDGSSGAGKCKGQTKQRL